MLGATGLFYSHFLGALLLPALALFHLFFVRKERRWWQPVVLLGLAALLALPQAPDLLAGIEHNQVERKNSIKRALGYPEVVSLLLLHLSDGLLEIQRPFSTLLALALPLPLLIAGWRSRHGRQAHGAVWYLSLTCALQLLLLLGANEWLQVLEKIPRSLPVDPVAARHVLLIKRGLWHRKRALLATSQLALCWPP